MSWEYNEERLRQICASVGCVLVRRIPTRVGDPVAWQIDCPGRWSTVKLLDALAWEDSKDTALWVLAHDLEMKARALGVSVPGFLLAWVQKNVRYIDEDIETFIGWRETLARGGDCDDLAKLLVAMLRALKRKARLATLGNPPIHVAAQVWELRGWQWLEATVPGARVGEHPREACRRLGLPIRQDLAG